MTEAEKEYILQCGCSEIQEIWEPKEGERVYDIESKEIRHLKRVINIINVSNAVKERNIFLPTTDQIMEWVDWNFVFLKIWKNQIRWQLQVSNGKTRMMITGRSYESIHLQLWMWQNHNKKWKDGRWIK